MTRLSSSPVTIGIIGAGFSGVALAAALHHASTAPLHLVLIDKSGEFGAGDAYRTPYPFHLLNARVKDMSAYEHDPTHFERWLQGSAEAYPYIDITSSLSTQFMPRFLYKSYLEDVLRAIERDTDSNITITRQAAEVTDVIYLDDFYHLVTPKGDIIVDKVVFCLGNAPASAFPFPVADDLPRVDNPWHYTAVNDIPNHADVVIVGSGLSMIDAVLTLHHHGHEGKITVVSRHGLLPLPHTNNHAIPDLDWQASPDTLRSLMRQVRDASMKLAAQGGDWRALMNVMRHQLPELWQQASKACRQRFIRHVLPYWNIHRHRVHQGLHDLLETLKAKKQLTVVSGRVEFAKMGEVAIRERYTSQPSIHSADWIVNCMGSSLEWKPAIFPLLDRLLAQGMATLDDLRLGLAVTPFYELVNQQGEASPSCYALGPLVKGVAWETVAAPEIRKQCLKLSEALLTSL